MREHITPWALCPKAVVGVWVVSTLIEFSPLNYELREIKSYAVFYFILFFKQKLYNQISYVAYKTVSAIKRIPLMKTNRSKTENRKRKTRLIVQRYERN